MALFRAVLNNIIIMVNLFFKLLRAKDLCPIHFNSKHYARKLTNLPAVSTHFWTCPLLILSSFLLFMSPICGCEWTPVI